MGLKLRTYGRTALLFPVFSRKIVSERGANVRVKSELSPETLRVTGPTFRGCSIE